jgi:hypothetical protein
MADELKDFVQETIRQVQEGSAGTLPVGEIDFEVAVAKTQEADGKVGIAVIGIGGAGVKGKVKDEQVSKVKFSVRLKGAVLKTAPVSWPPK